MYTYFTKMVSTKSIIFLGFFLVFLALVQFLPSYVEAGAGGGEGGGIEINIGPIDIDLGNLVDVNGNPINPLEPPPAITAGGDGTAQWCWSGTCYTGTDQQAIDFVTYYLGLIVGEFGTVTGSTVLYDDAGRVIYIACVNGGIVNVTYSNPGGTTDLCPNDAGTQTSLSECSCTPINSCADTTCNTTTCYNGCTTVTGTMDCSVSQDADLSGLPATIDIGDSSSLNYSCNPAAPATILPTVGALNGGAPVTSDSVSVSPVVNTTYTLTCFGPTNASVDTTITINAACVPYSGQPCNPVNICGMTNAGTYDCAGVCSVSAPADALCPANTNPGAPSITGPFSSDAGVTNVFTLTAVDADGDSINYQVDWDNDGTVDETTAAAASGDSRNVTRTWAVDGVYTFSARTVDSLGGLSAWTTHVISVTVNACSPASWDCYDQYVTSGFLTGTYLSSMCQPVGDPVPSPWTFEMNTAEYSFNGNYATPPIGMFTSCTPGTSVIMQAQINGGAWSDTDQTISSGDTVEVLWVSSGATSCNGTNVATGGGTYNTGVSVTPPAPGSSTTYTISCTGPGGTASSDIVISTIQLPNLTQPSVNFTPSATVDPITGDYDSVVVTFQTGNNGGSNTNTTVTYIVEIDYGNNGSYDVSQTGTIPSIAAGGTVNGSETFTNVPFGNNTVRVTIDTTNNVSETDETDNSRTLAMTLVPAAPNLQFTADKDVVREGQTVTISWNTGVTYPLNCSVSGPALVTYSFDPSVNGTTGNRTTGVLSSKSEFLLSCTEPLTNTTFTETVAVEVIPTAEEI